MSETTPVILPDQRRKYVRPIMRVLIRIALALLTDLRIVGQENLPDRGPLLLVGNHFHFVDPLIFIRIAPWPIEFVGNAAMPNAPLSVRIFPKIWKTYEVERARSSRSALIAAKDLLDRGGILGIFPEAGSWAKVLRPARPGTALLALRTGTPLVPVGLYGLNDIFPALKKFKRARVTVSIGKQFGPYEGNASGRADRELLEEVGHDIMRHIAPLIPPVSHGFYSDDPEIRSAAEEDSKYPWSIE
jgi:1-acyl-sn-glycerol-3-phosphate acyltransferase